MKYYLFEEQGGGCDCTIGCGLSRIKAETMQEALAEAEKRIINSGGCSDMEYGIESARILAVSEEIEVNMDALHQREERCGEKREGTVGPAERKVRRIMTVEEIISKVRIGMNRREVIECLGEPDDFSLLPKRGPPYVLKYGDIELHFSGGWGGVMWMVYSEDAVGEGANVMIADRKGYGAA